MRWRAVCQVVQALLQSPKPACRPQSQATCWRFLLRSLAIIQLTQIWHPRPASLWRPVCHRLYHPSFSSPFSIMNRMHQHSQPGCAPLCHPPQQQCRMCFSRFCQQLPWSAHSTHKPLKLDMRYQGLHGQAASTYSRTLRLCTQCCQSHWIMVRHA